MIRIRLMTGDDVPLGMRLKGQAGWNQTEADWRRALDLQPDGCFVAELDGVPAGTAATCVFGPVAWVALVLVDEAVRGRGIGRALMQHALDFLDGRGVRTIRLDASPAGRPLYLKLGFVEEFALARFDGVLPAAREAADPRIVTARPEQWQALFALDHAVSGTDRRRLLQWLFEEHPAEVRVAQKGGRITAMATARPGTLAWHIGPCSAAGGLGDALLADAFLRHARQRVFLDIPTANTAVVRQAEAAGLSVQRPLYRMSRGPLVKEHPSQIWCAFGPEKG